MSKFSRNDSPMAPEQMSEKIQTFKISTYYVSVNAKPDHPPGDRRGFAHSSCPWGRVFAPLSCPGVSPGSLPRGVLNQSKSSIILKKVRFLLCLLNKWVAALFICLYIPEVSSVT